MAGELHHFNRILQGLQVSLRCNVQRQGDAAFCVTSRMLSIVPQDEMGAGMQS